MAQKKPVYCLKALLNNKLVFLAASYEPLALSCFLMALAKHNQLRAKS